MGLPGISSLFEDVQRFLPPYLSADDKAQLFAELRRLREDDQVFNYFWANPDLTEALQGDVWRPLIVRNFEDGATKGVSGIILSNSCDIDPANDPDPSQNVIFAPLRSLARFAHALSERGKSPEQVESILRNIRRQLQTDVFYLPAYGDVLPESIVALDDLHAHPLRHFLQTRQQRVATLSQAGHYIFLVKLSIHFTRLQENVRRRESPKEHA